MEEFIRSNLSWGEVGVGGAINDDGSGGRGGGRGRSRVQSREGNVRRIARPGRRRVGEEEEDDAANIPAPWTDVDEARLVALRNAPIEMADTSYGRFLATQKRDAERAYQHMDADEREAFLRKLSEIDADEAENGQSTPTNPTPI